MAQRLAEQLDPTRFGVRALYLVGSAKNANAGPDSDIDLLVHLAPGEDGRGELEAWLEGWSLKLRSALQELNAPAVSPSSEPAGA